MSKYVGQPCSSCRNVFKEDDEIVVCPECGSPYHKECYKREGRCINTFLHESGGEWHPEPVMQNTAAEISDRVCPNCGTHNSHDAFYCTGCGASLSGEHPERPEVINASHDQYSPDFNNRQGANPYPNPYANPYFNPQVNVRTVTEDTEMGSGTVSEYTKYVGPKFMYYIPKFLKFSNNGGKVSFNFAAFFFPHLWFFYRKMILPGIITVFIWVLAGIPSMIEYIAMLSAEAAGQIYNFELEQNPVFYACSIIGTILIWAIRLVSCLFGNYIYYKKATSDIEKIKAGTPEAGKRDWLYAGKGGTSVLLVVITLVLLSAVSICLSVGIMSRFGLGVIAGA